MSRATVGSLATAAVEARRLAAAEYRFCATSSCPVAYFGSGGVRLDRNDLRAEIHQKNDGGDVPLCYCFGYTRDRLAREGEAARAYVAAEVKAGRCACEVKNPSGRCCLGDLARFLRRRGSAPD